MDISWIDPLVLIVATAAVVGAGWFVQRFLKRQLPANLQAAIYQVVSSLLGDLLRRSIPPDYPAPPRSLATITAIELDGILQAIGLTNICLGSASYELSSLDEYRRFLKYYKDTHPYNLDEYDCNVYALVLLAEACKWMHGKFVWGMLWGESADVNYPFPAHGFNFVVTADKKVHYCDELCVAAPEDDFMEAYPVRSYLTMA